jgi:hypothetical protein
MAFRALDEVLDLLKYFDPMPQYKKIYDMFTTSLVRAIHTVQNANLLDTPTWMRFGEQLSAISTLCHSAQYTQKMPRLFGRLGGSIKASVDNGWNAVPLHSRRKHLLALFHTIGRVFRDLPEYDYEGWLGAYSAYAIKNIAIALLNAE